MIYFNEQNHTYKDNTGKRYRSVTELINKYKIPFNKNIAYAVAKKENRSVEEVRAEWKAKADLSIIRGNYLHDTLDLLFRYPQLAKNSDLQHEYEQIQALIPKDYKIHTERILANKEYNIAGTIDLIATKGKEAIIIDYKTNDLDKPAYNNFKEPIQDLEETKLNTYMLQLNLYRFIVEQQGFKVSKMVIANWQQQNMEFIEVDRIEDELLVKLLTGNYKSKTIKI